MILSYDCRAIAATAVILSGVAAFLFAFRSSKRGRHAVEESLSVFWEAVRP